MKDTNPKLEFYKLVYQLLTAQEFIELVAERILRLQEEHAEVITMSGLTIESLREEQEEQLFQREKERTGNTDLLNGLMQAMFRDLAPQLRTEEVQSLVCKYKRLMPKKHYHFLVHSRSVKHHGGDGCATVTLVVSDVYRLFFTLSEDAWVSGEV